MTRRPVLVGLVLVGALLVGLAVVVTSGGNDGLLAEEVLAGAPRIPDDHGVIATADAEGVEFTDGRAFVFGPDTIIVSSYTLEPVRPRANLFVHVGLDGDVVTWMAILGVVVKVDPAVVSYTGTITGVEDGAVYFADGAVMPLEPGVDGHAGYAIATLDPTSGRVVDVEQQDVSPEPTPSR